MARLARASRIEASENSIRYVRFFDDFPVQPLSNLWSDTNRAGYVDAKRFVVQTSSKVLERCLLMTTDPGDLVLDPTCGSGTTAYVAERWGRRWITIDTSRVAVAIARQRILTSTYEHYKLKNEVTGPAGGLVYKTVPHITLKSIAQNVALDPVFAKYEPILAARLDALNTALTQDVSLELRAQLAAKLEMKQRREGKRAVTDADRRRWLLPKERWQVWEVPFDADPDWPAPLAEALMAYRRAWRAKMDEVNATIAASAEQEELVDQPEIVRGVTRVSGPFTVEAVMPPEERLDLEPSPVDELDEELGTFDATAGAHGGPNGRAGLAQANGDLGGAAGTESANAEAYVDEMVRLLRGDGVRFPDNKQMTFSRLERLDAAGGGRIHAEGQWGPAGSGGVERRVAVVIGPQYGPITAKLVEDSLWSVSRLGYDDLLFAGFQFDAAAQATIQDDPNPRVRIHQAVIRPDVAMKDMLKDTPNSQLFTVFGLPRTRLEQAADGTWTVTMEGVDVYDPVANTVVSTGASKVAAWFVDTDYDGRTFCICQAFFPDKSAWEKLARALKGVVDEDAFAQFSGTASLPFPTGTHKRVAVKVIDPRGNEVLRVHALTAEAVYAAP